MTMFDARTNLSIQVVEDVKKHFRNKVYRSIIPRNVRLGEASESWNAYYFIRSQMRGSGSILRISRRILENNEEMI